jgi:hypothetical protein
VLVEVGPKRRVNWIAQGVRIVVMSPDLNV